MEPLFDGFHWFTDMTNLPDTDTGPNPPTSPPAAHGSAAGNQGYPGLVGADAHARAACELGYRLRDQGHVDGLPAPVQFHLLREPACIDGQRFIACTCGWVREYYTTPPTQCAVDEAEDEYAIALWCAEKRITAAKARGERDATALRMAMAGERR